MQTFIYTAITLLLLVLVVYIITTGQQTAKNNKRIRELEREVDNLRNRRMTANGGLSMADKLKVLDLIAIADTIEDDNKLIQLRIADLKRRLTEILKTKKKEMK